MTSWSCFDLASFRTKWLSKYDRDSVKLEAIMKRHIETVLKHFKGGLDPGPLLTKHCQIHHRQ